MRKILTSYDGEVEINQKVAHKFLFDTTAEILALNPNSFHIYNVNIYFVFFFYLTKKNHIEHLRVN